MHFFDELELEAVRRVIEKKKLFRYQVGVESECQAFEREFAKHMGTKHALLVTSGTNALIAALCALDIGPGDEVLIPAYTFVATALAVYQVGAVPVVININEQLSLDLKQAEEKITSRTKALIVVHMDGLASSMTEVIDFSKKFNLQVIEDTAQALGGSYEKKRLGTWGELGCFSLNQDKNLTCGEGGIVVTDDDMLFEKLFCLQDGSAAFNPANKDFFKYITPFMGMSMRVSEISGAIMRSQLTRLEEILTLLRERKEIFLSALEGISHVKVIRGASLEGDCATSLHLRFSDPLQAQMLGKKLREKNLLFIPPTMRPAHVVWKWAGLIASDKARLPSLNPHQHHDEERKYPQAEFLTSTEILMGIIKMDMSVHWSLEETKRLALELSNTLRAKN